MGPTTRKTTVHIISDMVLILVGLMIGGLALYAQGDVQSRVSNTALSVNVENIRIQADSIIHGFTPNFPYPVISTITVFDSAGNFVTDLADTTRWLGPDDLAQIGLPIRQIWSPLVEYHAEDPTIPANPDLYQQVPGPLIREVLHDRHIPTSTMLVMDVSTSMTEKLDEAKAGARLYINQLRPVDRAGIVLFNHEVVKIQPFTSDKNVLIETIDNAKTDFGTALYDALMAAIQQTKLEVSRPRIIVYTDGRDNNSATTAEAVIDSALAYHIPIYTICLGDFTIRDILRNIADRTGGLFYLVESAEQMSGVYQRLADLIEHFYLLAHFSPDPIRNNTWRVVDVTVNLPASLGNFRLQGTGSYFVPGTTPADLSIQLAAVTDTSTVIGDHTFNAVMPGQSYHYLLKIKNHGPGKAGYVRIIQTLPDSVKLINASMPTFIQKQSMLLWQFTNFAAQEEREIAVTVHFPEPRSNTITLLTSQAELLADSDDNLENNRAKDTVHVLYPMPSDLSIELVSATDTTVMIGKRTVNAVMPGQNFQYLIKMKNHGPGQSGLVMISQLLPDSVTFIHATMQPIIDHEDRLRWQLTNIPTNQERMIVVTVHVPQQNSNELRQLVSQAELFADNDLNAENNRSQDTVFVIYPRQIFNYDLAIEQTVLTDSTVLLGNRMVPAVLPGGRIDYQIVVENLGPGTARELQVLNILPNLSEVVDIYPRPLTLRSDSLFWKFDSLPPGDRIEIAMHLTAADSIAAAFLPLINISLVSARQDTFLENNQSITTVYTILPSNQTTKFYDLVLQQRVRTDSIAVIGGESFQVARTGGMIEYQLMIENLGPAAAKDFSVQNLLPNFARCTDAGIAPDSIDRNVLIWKIDSLSAGGSIVRSFHAQVADSLPSQLWPLVNTAWLVAENDTNPLNNSSQSTVYGVGIFHDSTESKVDIRVWQTAITDSMAIVDGDTVRFTRMGSKIRWTILVTNVSPHPAKSVRLTNYLSPYTVAQLYQPLPAMMTADSVSWDLGDIPALAMRSVTLDVHVADSMPIGTHLLISKAKVWAGNEDPQFLKDNMAMDTVYCVVTPPSDWLPQIVATPPRIDVGDEISVKVRVPYPIEQWDLWVYLADGSIDQSYADDFIMNNRLDPNQWLEVHEKYTNTRLVTAAEQEPIVFEIRTVDAFGTLRTAQTAVIVQSSNMFYLDRNIYEAFRPDPLGIHFKLSSNRLARLELFDFAGRKVTTLAEQYYPAGWNALHWNGTLEDGSKIGSGVYLITLKSGNFHQMKKVMVVQ